MGGKVLDFEATRIRDAALAEGRQEGLAQGRQEGLAQGRQEGLAQGRQDMVRKMLRSKKLSVGEIARMAGLSEEAVRALS